MALIRFDTGLYVDPWSVVGVQAIALGASLVLDNKERVIVSMSAEDAATAVNLGRENG